jgi:hypothetical protein
MVTLVANVKARTTILLLLAGIVLFVAAAWLARANRPCLPDGRAAPELRDAPPLVLFTTVALGGFRGLAADLLWIRATDLQDEGRYFEVVQLSDWISKLEPQISEVWAFLAWNMAYNISVMFPAPEDRWRWVQHGLNLLRVDGLRYNPDDPHLYWELGWLYQHKIGGPWDDLGPFYRRQIAQEAEELLPGGQWAAAAADPARRARAAERWRMTPDLISEVDRRYGPFDWRVPETHAVYWAARGVRAAGVKGNTGCDRLLYQALIELFRRGRLVYDPARNLYLRLPRFNTDGVLRGLDEVAQRWGAGEISEIYASWLREALLYAQAYGRRTEVEQLRALRRGRGEESDMSDTSDAYIRRLATEWMQPMGPPDTRWLLGDLLRRARAAAAAGEQADAAGLEKLTEILWEGYVAAAEKRAKPADPNLLKTIQEEMGHAAP